LEHSDRPLRVKLGIDPTGAEIHLGHSIPVRKLRAFQDAGHTAVLIIGDFTARIGDPTGKSEVRRQLTVAEVQANAQTYLDQVRPILDFDTPGRLEIRYNSEWLSTLDLGNIIELLGTMTVGQMLAKEGFADRYDKGNPVFLHEFLYPLMQGYDSVAVQADVELGGTDQKFNIAVGRDLQRHFGSPPQFGMLMPLLLGTDGSQKMSKSLGNYVGLREDPLTMYSKLEKIPDTLIRDYFELLTSIDLATLPPNHSVPWSCGSPAGPTGGPHPGAGGRRGGNGGTGVFPDGDYLSRQVVLHCRRHGAVPHQQRGSAANSGGWGQARGGKDRRS
jgi:tyrosyl-tRNA synthetase